MHCAWRQLDGRAVVIGTRADFYVGRGKDAEWIGSIAWDGYPSGVFAEGQDDYLPPTISDEDHWRVAIEQFLSQRDDATTPDQGWPWPWNDSRTTDFAFAFEEGKVWATAGRYGWWPVDELEPYDDEGEWTGPMSEVVFPDMGHLKRVALDKRSGLIILSDTS